jgi:hypothetical protein
LTEEFKYSLDKNKKKYPTNYVERTLRQFSTIQYASEPESDNDEKPIEESPKDKKI